MIPNQWYIVLESQQVKSGRPIGVTRFGERLVFWRQTSGQVICQRDRCAHRGVALSAGKVVHDHIQCPFHGFEYDASGRCQLIPANGQGTPVGAQYQVQTYPTREAHGLIYVWYGDGQPGEADVPFFADIDASFSFGRARDPWKAHYSRAIENQLDAVHLPFVHHNTIGRGNRTVVNGPLVEWQSEDRFRVYVANQVDDGRPPLRSDEMAKPATDFHLEFVFPNLWQNHLGRDARIVIAFVPVDGENSLLYIRFYQRFVRLPIVRDLFNLLAMPFNLRIAHQDRRIVETQQPKASALRIDEKLIHGDNPIIAYRRRRQEMIDQASPAE